VKLQLYNAIKDAPLPHHVDIWLVRLNHDQPQDLAALLSLLDERERERYQRLHHSHKLHYLFSHAACRQILAQYTKLSAKEIRYNTNAYGKPRLSHDTTIRFNMSHSHELAIIAISGHAEIGVDLEYSERKTDWSNLARRFFSPQEVSYLFQQQEKAQRLSFFQLWTRKEAFIKALGTGLSTPLDSFNVCSKQVIERLKPSVNELSWYQADLKVAAPYLASLVQNTPIEKIRYYSYP